MNPAEFANIARSEQRFWWYRGMNRILFRVLDPMARRREYRSVLEAGCGTGYLSKLLGQRYEWRMTPLDLGWEGLDFAAGMGVRRLVQGDVAKLPFRDSAFDLALSMDVIVHFPRGGERAAMQEMVRVLEPGGDLVIRVSALDALRSRHSQFASERQRFTRSRLKRLAESCGLRVERCTYANALLLPVAFFKFRVWEPMLRRPPSSGVEPVADWLDSLLYLPLAAEARWIGGGGNFPLGQSLILVAQKHVAEPRPARQLRNLH